MSWPDALVSIVSTVAVAVMVIGVLYFGNKG